MSNNKKFYIKKQKEDDGFMDLNSLQSTKNVEELEIIDETLNQLKQNITRYIEISKDIWDEHIESFLLSSNCNTLQHLSENDNNKFVQFMFTQKTFKLMLIAKTRLIKRREYIVRHM